MIERTGIAAEQRAEILGCQLLAIEIRMPEAFIANHCDALLNKIELRMNEAAKEIASA